MGETVLLPDVGQCRSLAVELSGMGFVVRVCDPEGRDRPQLWPPRLHN